MKKILIGLVALGTVTVGSPAFAAEFTFYDNYYGGSDWSAYTQPAGPPGTTIVKETDIIGNPDSYDVSKMIVNIDTSITVSIYTRYLNNIGSAGTGLGDLFISTDDWSPFGSAASFYDMDVAANGEHWEYALVLDSRYGTRTSGNAYLYAVEQNRIVTAGPSETSNYRLGQEVRYNTLGLDATDIKVQGGWSINDGLTNSDEDDYLTFTFANVIGLKDTDFAFRWSMTCANDIIEAGSPVPEPATMLLFGAGVLGLAGRTFGRKKK